MAKKKGTPKAAEVRPKQRHRRLDPDKMAEYIVVFAWTGPRTRGKWEINLDKCAWYKAEASE